MLSHCVTPSPTSSAFILTTTEEGAEKRVSRQCCPEGARGWGPHVTGCEVRMLGEGVRVRIDGRGNVDLEVQTNNLVPSLEHEKDPSCRTSTRI